MPCYNGTEKISMLVKDELAWDPAPERIPWPFDTIHVWRASLSQPPSVLERMAKTMSEDELVRAQRYRFAKDKDAFIAGRGILRDVLARYLKIVPHQIHLEYGPWGKPEVTTLVGGARLDFNLSHSGDLVLIAVALNRKIGIDIEWMPRKPVTERIAERFFSPSEALFLRTLSGEARQDAFFRLWTAKEAFVKAQGIGLARSFSEFTVSLISEKEIDITDIEGKAEDISRWSLKVLPVNSEYIAALAAEDFRGTVYCWEWPGGLQQFNGLF